MDKSLYNLLYNEAAAVTRYFCAILARIRVRRTEYGNDYIVNYTVG